MKISKLFHWLYAFLMFLPIFAIAVKCGYVMLNKNSQDSYSGSYSYLGTPNYSIEITNTSSYTSYVGLQETFIFSADSVYPITTYGNRGFVFHNVQVFIPNVDIDFSSINYVTFIGDGGNSNFDIYFCTLDATGGTPLVPKGVVHQLTSSDTFYLTFSSSTEYKAPYYSATPMSINVQYNTYVIDTTLSSVFYSSLQELDNVEFFSWAKNSFLAEPFMYIGNLFGIPNVHPIFTFLSYWLAISVIWLVFDVFMYVPLLAHKWIDKGKVD